VAEQQSKAGRGDARRQKRADLEVWRDQAAAIGWRHGTVLEGAPAPALTDTERCETACAFAAERLAEEFRTAAVLDRDKLDLWAARGLIAVGIAGPQDVLDAAPVESGTSPPRQPSGGRRSRFDLRPGVQRRAVRGPHGPRPTE
jgi:hypothetical protein